MREKLVDDDLDHEFIDLETKRKWSARDLLTFLPRSGDGFERKSPLSVAVDQTPMFGMFMGRTTESQRFLETEWAGELDDFISYLRVMHRLAVTPPNNSMFRRVWGMKQAFLEFVRRTHEGVGVKFDASTKTKAGGLAHDQAWVCFVDSLANFSGRRELISTIRDNGMWRPFDGCVSPHHDVKIGRSAGQWLLLNGPNIVDESRPWLEKRVLRPELQSPTSLQTVDLATDRVLDWPAGAHDDKGKMGWIFGRDGNREVFHGLTYRQGGYGEHPHIEYRTETQKQCGPHFQVGVAAFPMTSGKTCGNVA